MQQRQRNPGNEIIVAIAALGALALSVVFAIVLTLDSAQPAPETPSPDSNISAQGITATVPTGTEEQDTPTDTNTPRATTAVVVIASASSTRVTPSATRTDRPARTSTETERSGSPTHTATATGTQTPTATRTDPSIPTNTAMVKTPTSSPTTAATTLLNSATPSPSTASTEPATPTTCPRPSGWELYTVQRGNTLFSLARRFNITLSRLQEANCIEDASDIEAGQVLYVPPGSLAASPASTQSTGSTDSTPPPAMTGCALAYVRISAPSPDANLTNTFIMRGTATLPDPEQFSFYKVEIRPGNSSDAAFANLNLRDVPAPGENDALAVVNPAGFEPGTYLLRLTVVDTSGNFPQPCTIRVTFP